MVINCIGQMFGTSGYSSHFRSLVNELNKLTKCKIVTNLPNGFEREVNDAELEMIKREQDYDINLVVTHPVNWKSNLSAKRNWVYLIWEGDKIPKWMLLECFNDKIEKIIVPSKHTYDAILKTQEELCSKQSLEKNDDWWFTVDVKNKVIVIPHGVDLETFHPLPQGERVFTFLMNKGFRNMEDRGGVQYGLKAYLEEFKKEDKVELILKINPAYGIPNILEMFPELKEKDAPDVRLITEDYTKKQLNELYNECDVFVSPTRAEAFNLPCLEAMACEKPVITTNFGGQIDFCDNTTGALIDYDLTEVTHELEYEGIKWATPNHNHLKQLLRAAYICRNGAATQSGNKIIFHKSCKELGRKSLEVAKKLTWENCAKQISNLINR